MGNLIYGTLWRTPSAVLKSSENASFPATNAKLLRYPHRPWKASAAIQNEWVGYDWGTATGMAACVIDHANVTSVKVQADTAATFDSVGGTTPAYDPDAVTLSQDLRDGRYKLFFPMVQTYRYARVKVMSASTTDSSSVAKLGSVGFLGTYVTLTKNFGFPLQWVNRKPVLGVGRGEPVAIGNRYAQLILGRTNWPSSAAMDDVFNTMLGYGEDQLYCIYVNNSDTSEVYICDRVGDITVSQPGPNVHTLEQQLVFREVGDLAA